MRRAPIHLLDTPDSLEQVLAFAHIRAGTGPCFAPIWPRMSSGRADSLREPTEQDNLP
jgi:hypothetical protein